MTSDKDQEPQSTLRGIKCRYLRVKPHFNEPTARAHAGDREICSWHTEIKRELSK